MRFAWPLFVTGIGLLGCGGGDDGGAAVDAQAGEFVPSGIALEAESSFNRSSVDQLHAWIDNNSEVGFSGSGYAEALPNDGTTCTEPYTNCGASLAFNVDIPETGSYFVYFHTFAGDLVDDSLAWSTNAGASELVVHPTLGSWTWIRSMGSFSAQPGARVFTVHMTEDGVKLDMIVLSTDGDQL